MKLDFSCNGIPAGFFIERDTYPRSPGEYRYMPYRSQGHLALQTPAPDKGPVRCEYVDGGNQSTFYARPGKSYGLLIIEALGRVGE